jgi:energy-coupling factor transporter ATP-binding protein EcfA2
MKIKDLKVELAQSGDGSPIRELGIGPFNPGLNFVYGERGAGKSTLRQQISELLINAKHGKVANLSPNCGAISIVVERGTHQYQISRDAAGQHKVSCLTATSSYNAYRPVESIAKSNHFAALPQVERDFVDNISFPGFSDPVSRMPRLYRALKTRFHVPSGATAAGDNSQSLQRQQERFELQRQIEQLTASLEALNGERLSISADLDRHRATSQSTLHGIETQIRTLTARLSELDPTRIRLEIETVEREIARLNIELQQLSTVVHKTQESPYLPTLYRLLDEVEQHTREIRSVQSNVQQHRVRLKNEMEMWNQLTLEQDQHPYHRTREILRIIEGRIDQVEAHSNQWVDDHGTVDAQQAARFLDESCRAIREDLSVLCEELSDRYREIRHRSATQELKELRYNYNQISDVTRNTLDRRESILAELRSADPQGAAAIDNATAEFSMVAANDGNLVARERFVGKLPVESYLQSTSTVATHTPGDAATIRQQLASYESRLLTLRSSLSSSQSECELISRQITELNLQKEPSVSLLESQWQARLSQIDSQRATLESELVQLKGKLGTLSIEVVTPHPILVSASNVLQHLTGGDFSRVWLSETHEEFSVLDRQGNSIATSAISENGISQLVQLAIVLATNETDSEHELPLILDDLFADQETKRIDSSLETLVRWSQENQRQVIVLTQHRFLADRVPGATVLELKSDQPTEAWRPVTRDIVSVNREDRQQPHARSWYPISTAISASPVAEYPRSPLPRPYPLSKYPRTSDRQRNETLVDHEDFETAELYEHRVPNKRTSVREESRAKASSVSAAEFGDQMEVTAVSEDTLIESVSMFDATQLRCLDQHDILRVQQFLELDSDGLPEEFSSCYLSGDSLSELQAAVWLMMWVPSLMADSAQALVACGISEPSHLLTSNVDSLFERLSRFLRSPDGRRFNSTRYPLSRDSIFNWQNQLRSNRGYRNQRRPYPRSSFQRDSRKPSLRAYSPRENNSHREERSRGAREQRTARMPARSSRMQTPADRADRQRRTDRDRRDDRDRRSYSRSEREPREARENHERSDSFAPALPPRSPRSSRKESTRKPDAVRQTPNRQEIVSRSSSANSNSTRSSSMANEVKLKFYLDLTDHIEAAPSIGPKTAERFEAIGVVTVSDFLRQTAESMSEKLDYKRLSANVLRQWQHQTRLVCRVPNLRGHDAQLLVGCGIIDAEEIATMRPETLFEKVGPFSDTKEGMKIIRNGKKPDLAEITDWISFAQHTRSIQAA